MYFSNAPLQKEFEKMMQEVLRFSPRGHGSFISKEALNLYESSKPPPASLSGAIERTMSRIHCLSFRRRLEQYLKESEREPMDCLSRTWQSVCHTASAQHQIKPQLCGGDRIAPSARTDQPRVAESLGR